MLSRWEWLDYDEAESKQVRDFLSAEVDGEGVDPLRIGALVRDKMANILFPGTSTQYTRLRYVFLAPAMLRKKGATFAGLAQSQATFNDSMVRANPKAPGIIGKRVRERDFVRLYWTAIRTWKLLTPVNGDERDTTIENGLAALQSHAEVDEEGSTFAGHRVRWDPAVLKFADFFWKGKEQPSGWPNIQCTRAETEFIIERWVSLPGTPALAALASQVRESRKVSQFELPWSVPMNRFPQARAQLDRAKAVSLICWAAQLAYNFALIKQARKLEQNGAHCGWKKGAMDTMEHKIVEQYDRWTHAHEEEQLLLSPWIDSGHWDDLGSITSRPFLARAAQLLCAGDINLRSSQWVELVKTREKNVNPAPKLANTAHLAAWSGTAEMSKRWDFRWKASVQQFLRDAETPHG